MIWATLATFLIWPFAIWFANRHATARASSSLMTAIFYLSAASPLLTLIIWFGLWIALSGKTDPKMLPLLLTLGLPLTIAASAIAYWGSRGRTGWP